MTRSELERMVEEARALFVSPRAPRPVRDVVRAYNDEVANFHDLLDCVRAAMSAGLAVDRQLEDELREAFEGLVGDRNRIEREAG